MRRLAFVLCLQFVTVFGCGQDPDSLSNHSKNSELDSVVLNSARSKWTNPREIPVCIMNRSAIGDEIFEDIKSYVKTEYSQKTGIGFVGWGSCTSAQKTGSV